MKLSVLRAGSAPSRAGLAVGMLPAELVGEAQAAAGWSGPGLLESFFDSARPTGLSYWDLHGGLLVPTVWLLTAGMPSLLRSSSEGSSKLTRTASFAFLGFILTIAVLQAFVWDSVGAEIGIWQFNPEKTTGLGASTLLPLEEVLWLFHHVIKAALWQLKIADFDLAKPGAPPAPLPAAAMAGGNAALAALAVGGAAALLGEYDSAKCVGLVAAFFAPVLMIVFNLGGRYFLSHWRLFLLVRCNHICNTPVTTPGNHTCKLTTSVTSVDHISIHTCQGWAPPGWWTVAIDCVGQQQGVWSPRRALDWCT